MYEPSDCLTAQIQPRPGMVLADASNPCSDEGQAQRAQEVLLQQAKLYVTGKTAAATDAAKAALEQICTDGVKCRLKQNIVPIIGIGVGVIAGSAILGHLLIPRILKRK